MWNAVRHINSNFTLPLPHTHKGHVFTNPYIIPTDMLSHTCFELARLINLLPHVLNAGQFSFTAKGGKIITHKIRVLSDCCTPLLGYSSQIYLNDYDNVPDLPWHKCTVHSATRKTLHIAE